MSRAKPGKAHLVVIGGGHAGLEAAAAAARIGVEVTLLTHSLETIGQLSCNPAVGGVGKSHLVREIDAMDGLMASCADAAGIHYRVLNSSKGPAVRATRAQTDRNLYRSNARRLLEQNASVSLLQGEAASLVIKNDSITGVKLADNTIIEARAVVLTAGTFLAGKLHMGRKCSSGGRAGDRSADNLAAALRDLGLPVGRLKTGTPPRLDGRSIDFRRCAAQPSTRPLPSLCMLPSKKRRPRQIDCHLTATNERTHEIVRAALPEAPMSSGAISGVGPRYCPSLEDKVERFAERDSHKIFLEPESLDTAEIYPNGISTALPQEAQHELVRTIKGLEQAKITRYGYAVEYDYYDPRALTPSLAVAGIEGLYFAGQINGTTGYEEAGAQGLVAGANAALRLLGRDAWWPARSECYLGVLIDDLTSQGVIEPYRMFTSRAEFRLRLREDNADLRLTDTGRQLGLVGEHRWRVYNEQRELIEREAKRLEGLRTSGLGLEGGDKDGLTANRWLQQPQASYKQLAAVDENAIADRRAIAEIEARSKYTGLIERQEADVERARRYSDWKMPEDLVYESVHGLSNEAREKLSLHRPATLGQVARISGITPAAVNLLRIHLDTRRRS